MAQFPCQSNWRFGFSAPMYAAMRQDFDDGIADAYELIGTARQGRWLVTCDHASNRVPDCVNNGSLGLSGSDMNRHIAYDVGAAGVTRLLAHALNAPAVLSRFSRLVIDPNRGEDDPTLVMRLYDGTIIPTNRHVSETEIERRLNAFHRPYHAALSALAGARDDRVLVSVHSFTPRLNGRSPRPWHLGVLSADDRRLADPLLQRLAFERDIISGDNVPYHGKLGGDAMDRHGLTPGRPHVLVEIRNDLIETETGQMNWAARLAPLLIDALAASGL